MKSDDSQRSLQHKLTLNDLMSTNQFNNYSLVASITAPPRSNRLSCASLSDLSNENDYNIAE